MAISVTDEEAAATAVEEASIHHDNGNTVDEACFNFKMRRDSFKNFKICRIFGFFYLFIKSLFFIYFLTLPLQIVLFR